MVGRFAVLVIIAIARQVVWLVENPDRSVLPLHPCMKYIMQADFKPLMVKWWLFCNMCNHVQSLLGSNLGV